MPLIVHIVGRMQTKYGMLGAALIFTPVTSGRNF